jgi:hypothetical protein
MAGTAPIALLLLDPLPEELAEQASRRMQARPWPDGFETRYALPTMRGAQQT